MQRFKKWLMILSLAGPAAVVPSCSTSLVTGLRDAAINGAAAFVEEATFALLDTLITGASEQ
jgi:hypothetical protein